MFCSFALLLKASECLSIAGGFSEVKAADDYVQSIAEEVKSRVLRRYKGRKMYKAIEFEVEHIYAGEDYRIKLQVDENEFVTIKVLKPWIWEKLGPAEFKGFMGSRNNWPVGKPPKVPKLPAFKKSVDYDPDNFSMFKGPTKIVKSMLNQLKGEINKELGRETDAYISEAKGFARQRAEGGKFYLIQFETDNELCKALIFSSLDGKLELRKAYVLWTMDYSF